MKFRANGSRPLDNSAVQNKHSAIELSANDFSVLRRGGGFNCRPNAMSRNIRFREARITGQNLFIKNEGFLTS